jgi:hypothetical protein
VTFILVKVSRILCPIHAKLIRFKKENIEINKNRNKQKQKYLGVVNAGAD